ncbi:MAG: glycosyltransferase family 4 protein [Pseudodesulfovibrio sp.]|uniref:glycosyltransferase family 4 protein n=1 Tax=Pseudodesulfovibrio sp. TaxID=2035812 RepID=UPI003D0CDD2A
MEKGRKSLLVVTSTFPKYEHDHTPPFVYELSKRLTESFDVHVLAPFAQGSVRHEERDGMHISRFNFWPFSKRVTDEAIMPTLKKNRLYLFQLPFLLLFELIAIARAIRRLRPDFIHAHWAIPQGVLAVMAKFLARGECAIVCTAHGADLNSLRGLDGMKSFFMNRCAYLTAVSHDLEQKMLDMGVREDIPRSIIPMGADPDRFHSAKSKAALREELGLQGTVLLFVGRLCEAKGIAYLLEAMPDIIARHPDVNLLLVGSGDLEDSLKELAFDKLGLQSKVTFAGPKPNSELVQYFAAADMFVGPSLTEGAPVVLVESMLSGCLTLTSDIKTIDGMIEDGVTGYRFRQKDSKSICDCVERVLANPEAAEKARLQGREYARERFSWDVCAEKYKQVFLNL